MPRSITLSAATHLLSFLMLGCSPLEEMFQRFGEQVEGNGKVVTEERSLGAYRALSHEGAVDVVLQRGSGDIKVRADSNLLPLVRTEVSDSTLHVELEKGVSRARELEVVIPAKDLNKIESDGSGDIKNDKRLRWGTLKVLNEGSGDLALKLSAKDLHYEGDGSGDSKLEGSVDHLRIENYGSGDLDALELRAREAKCRSEGSGDLTLNVVIKLHIRSEGSGDVYYQKSPRNINVKSEGAGHVGTLQ